MSCFGKNPNLQLGWDLGGVSSLSRRKMPLWQHACGSPSRDFCSDHFSWRFAWSLWSVFSCVAVYIATCKAKTSTIQKGGQFLLLEIYVVHESTASTELWQCVDHLVDTSANRRSISSMIPFDLLDILIGQKYIPKTGNLVISRKIPSLKLI